MFNQNQSPYYYLNVFALGQNDNVIKYTIKENGRL